MSKDYFFTHSNHVVVQWYTHFECLNMVAWRTFWLT